MMNLNERSVGMEEKELDVGMEELVEKKIRAILNEKEEDVSREDELNAREEALRRRELRAQTVEALAKKKLPAELADAIAYTDEETCRAGLAATERAFRTAVQKAVDERLRGSVPNAGHSVDPEMLDDSDYYRVRLGM